jgi:hypothetical protein
MVSLGQFMNCPYNTASPTPWILIFAFLLTFEYFCNRLEINWEEPNLWKLIKPAKNFQTIKFSISLTI